MYKISIFEDTHKGRTEIGLSTNFGMVAFCESYKDALEMVHNERKQAEKENAKWFSKIDDAFNESDSVYSINIVSVGSKKTNWEYQSIFYVPIWKIK